LPIDGPFFLPSLNVPIATEGADHVFLIDDGSECGGNKVVAARVAFWTHDRGDYVLWRYTNWVQACSQGAGGGNRLFLSILPDVRAAFDAAH
jgi:hypothetical protein